MPTHKTEDYKLSAVKYYLKNDFSMKYICDIFATITYFLNIAYGNL